MGLYDVANLTESVTETCYGVFMHYQEKFETLFKIV